MGTGFTVIPLDSGRFLVQVIYGTSSLTGVIDKESLFLVRSWRGESRSSSSAPSSRAGVVRSPPVKCMFTPFSANKGEGMVTETGLVENLGWESRRAKLALDQLVCSDLQQNVHG